MSGGGELNRRSSRVSSLCLFILISSSLLLLRPHQAFPQAERALLIHSVVITGNHLVEESTIRYYLTTKAGQPFSVSSIREDIHKLYSLGFFDDIKVDTEEFEGRLIVTFVVKEKPSISKVTVEGAKEVSEGDIYKALTVRPNTIVNKKQIHESVEKVKSIYEEKGFYFAKVDYQVRELGERQVEVLFRISEGGKYKIKEIAFRGNAHLSDRQLRKVMETKQASLWNRIKSFGKTGQLVKEKLDKDTKRIYALYAMHGFIEAEVKKPVIKLSKERRGIVITLPVVEGKQYKVGKVAIITDEKFPTSQLRKTLNLNEGDIFNAPAMADKVRRLTDYFTERGFAFADINPRVDRRPEDNLVDVMLVVEKGDRVNFGRVDIRGNDRTRDKVIRREVAFQEGALYDSSLIRKSRSRLRRLDYFSEVEIGSQRRPGEKLVDMEVKVKEKQTGSFSGGGGFSSQQGVFMVGRITQRNLFGRGWKLTGEGVIGTERSDISLRFTEPHLLDTKVGATVEVVKRFQNFDTFNIDTRSGALSFGYPLSDDLSVALGYSYEKNELTGLKLTSAAQQALGVQTGKFITSALLPSLAYSTIDNPRRPVKGVRLTFRNKFSAGFLGSDLDYYRGVLDTRYYHPLPKTLLAFKTAPILMLRNMLGFATGFGSDELPIYERFFLGGGRSLRGFNFRDVGPKVDFGSPLGGTSAFLASAEVSFPLASIMEAVFFVDAGNVFLEGETMDITNLRYSIGPGLRANTPFGPIAVFWGFKLNKKASEKSSEFHFDLGRGF
jgi:outer membrane protein insertion porin family